MNEYDRNRVLIELLQKLTADGDKEAIELLGTMTDNDTESIKHTFKLLTGPSPLAELFGVENLGELRAYIVIYEQIYDCVEIVDVIDNDKFDEYVKDFKKKLLENNNFKEIVEEKHINNSYSFKIKHNHEGEPEEWCSGFEYAVFSRKNNFRYDKREDN